jgi:hypothetical protein
VNSNHGLYSILRGICIALAQHGVVHLLRRWVLPVPF